ncbi:probetacellulin isoform X2 [Pleurodeles waltl]|uniref:probetacellulin isoform X2 n=1 Tax=Pleurodeles waltl TaxID=8319 RepID=UPI00370975AB
MEPLSCLSSHLPLAAALLLGLTFLRCIGADWNSTAKNELKEALCAEAEENCTDSLEPEKGSHFSRCAKEYEHYCVKGKCRYVVEMKKPSCVCQHGYIGSRCELLDLYYLRGDRGQLVVIGLIAGLVAIVILIICTCACSHHCRRRRKEKKKEEHVETLNRDDSNTGDASESPVAPSVSVVDEANQTVSLHDECRSLTERGPEHLVD